MQSADHDLDQVKKVIKRNAYKVMRRLQAAGASFLQMDDIEQEMWVAYSIARDRYDPASNVPFLAYFTLGLRNHVNRCIERHIERNPGQTYALSLQQSVDPDDNSTLEEAVPSSVNTEREIGEKLTYEYALTQMRPLTAQFVRLMVELPEELCAEALKAQAKASHGRSMGITVSIQRQVTKKMIFDLLDCTPAERRSILNEIESFGEKVCRI
jgi:hypothetical protein